RTSLNVFAKFTQSDVAKHIDFISKFNAEELGNYIIKD
ncbi:MAG: hypothetical protein IIX55_08530, partial [Muribaculaceae bacterium]|nr:hypothetical protein [Muribaculaceae bacterium]